MIVNTIYFFMRSVAITSLFILSFLSSCTKTNDNDDNNRYFIGGSASGSQETPPNSSTATATLTGTYNPDNHILQFNINWTGLSGMATEANFHGFAFMGASPKVLIGITISNQGISGAASGMVTLTDSAAAVLLNGELFYNIHTAFYPDGEIQGQVIAIHE